MWERCIHVLFKLLLIIIGIYLFVTKVEPHELIQYIKIEVIQEFQWLELDSERTRNDSGLLCTDLLS